MGQHEQALNGDVIRAGLFTVSGAILALVSPGPGYGRVTAHSILLPSLGFEVVLVTHDGIHRNLIRALGLTKTAGVAAI
jgi:hypothetical protein